MVIKGMFPEDVAEALIKVRIHAIQRAIQRPRNTAPAQYSAALCIARTDDGESTLCSKSGLRLQVLNFTELAALGREKRFDRSTRTW
jgi:hypothetical protein